MFSHYLPMKTIIKSKSSNSNMQIKYIRPFIIHSNISKKQIHDLMSLIFKKCGDLQVFGYDRFRDEFWGKKIKEICELHFTITIVERKNKSIISVNPYVGSNESLQVLYKKIIGIILIYDNSLLFKKIECNYSSL